MLVKIIQSISAKSKREKKENISKKDSIVFLLNATWRHLYPEIPNYVSAGN